MPSYRKEARIPGRSAQELFDLVNRDIDRWFDKLPISNLHFERKAESRTLEAKHSFFTAKLSCTDGLIVLEGQLSFLAAPFRSRIDETLDRWIADTFPGVT